MPVTTSTKRLPSAEPGMEDRYGGRTHTVVFETDQTDGGSFAAAASIVIAAQVAGQIPLKGTTYSFDGLTDADSYLQEISWERPNPADLPRRVQVTCKYAPADGMDPGQLSETNPLLWPVEYWVDWVEEQVVLEEARNVEDLDFADVFPRPAGTLGKVVNACGIEFTEPLMKTIYYPVLNAQKNYQTLDEIIALNLAFQGTTNNASWFGGDPRTAKYLITESGRKQQVQGQSFYAGVTRVWFKKATWDRKVLNNGWSHFERPAGNDSTILYDATGNRAFFKNLIHDDPSALEDDDTLDPEAPCSEPLNLTLDGTLLGADDSAVYITYRDLEEVDYSAIGIGG